MKFDDAGSEGTGSNPGKGKDARQEDNVLPLPRDWLGPPEELVPFGPSAESDRSDLTGKAQDPELRSSSPEDFWGEHSASVQDALDRRDADAARLAGMPARLVAGVSDRRRVALVAGAAAVLALMVVGYVTLLNPSSHSGHSPLAAKLGSAGPSAVLPWSDSHPQLPASPFRGNGPSNKASHRARRRGRTVQVSYVPKTSSQVSSTQAVSTTSSSAAPPSSPAVTPTTPSPSSPSPSQQNRPRSNSSRPFGAHGVLGPGRSPSG